MKIRNYIRPLAASLPLLLSCGCGTLAHGGRQNITVWTDPGGATVTEGFISMASPAELQLSRRTDHVLRISKDGFHTCEIAVSRKYSPWIWASGIFPPFYIIDYYTGGCYELSPSEINVQLNPISDQNK